MQSENISNNTNFDNDEISFKELIFKIKEWFSFLKSKWLSIFIFGITGALIGLTIAMFEKPTYKAVLTFAMEEDKGGGGGGGGLSGALGLASSFGIDLGGSGGGGAFAASNLAELMKSRLMVEKVLLEPIVLNGKTMSLAEYYIQINDLRKSWEQNPSLKKIQFLPNDDKSYFTQILYFCKGLLIILAPLYFHFQETITIFKLLLINNEMFYLSLNFIETNKVIHLGIICSTLSSIFLFLKNFEIKKFVIFLDYFSILILNYFLSPLIAFTVYFCFLHSIRHSISLAIELDPNSVANGFGLFAKKALPLTILTGVFSFIALYLLTNSYNLDSAILKVIFIGLASLTFPHILLEYFLEKNEK